MKADKIVLDRMIALSRRLTLIPDFPRNEEAIEEVAANLIECCTDEKQAQELVTHACRYLTKWPGLPVLWEELYRMTHPDIAPSNQAVDYQKPPVVCKDCKDFGVIKTTSGRYRWCECETAKQLKADFPDWLDLSNRPSQPEKPRPKPSNIALIKPLTQTDIDAELKRRGRKPSGGDAA
jgi:hypothetical protein